MREQDPRQPAAEVDLLAVPIAACCPGAACGPIFETSLVEIALNRLRNAMRRDPSPAPETKAASHVSRKDQTHD
jgi:hypothetical protein